MVEPRASRFWLAAEQSGLLDAARLAACWDSIPPEKRTADAIDRRLARRAIDEGYLTVWQAQQLLAGRTGLRFGRYVLLELVGEGGMGRVYLARDTRLNRKVALKVLSRERMNNPRAVTRFQREARVGAQLQHENLVRIYDEGEANGHHFLVMEFIDGKTVGRIIHDYGPLPPPVAARLARQVALGLEHAQQKGMIHRDVNPMNILVDAEGNAKLTDLGLAIDLSDQEAMVTRDGATVGTFDYIAPEQARHSRSVDTRADIYSLGCTLYHMIAGRVPFPQPSLPEKLYGHQALEPDPLGTLAPGLPPGLEAVVRRMMAKSVDARYQTPAEVTRALEPYQSGPLTLEQVEAAAGAARLAIEADADAEGEGEGEANGSVGDGVEVLDGPRSDAELAPVATPAARPAPPETVVSPAVRAAPAAAPAANGARPGPAVLAAAESSSDPGVLIPALDLGPELTLSESVSGVRRATRPAPRVARSQARLWVGVALVLTALVALAALLANRGGGGATRPNPGAPITPDPAPNDSNRRIVEDSSRLPDIWVAFPDGIEPESTLVGAIRRGASRGADVVLGDRQPHRFEVKEMIEVPTGRLTLRAAPGASPILAVTLKGGAPFLSTNSRCKLRLVGLTLLVDTADGLSSPPPPVIAVGGDVELDHCTFTTNDREHALRLLDAQGLRTTLTGCQFEGFEAPLSVRAFPGSEVTLSQCLLARLRTDAPRPGWAVALEMPPSRPSPQPTQLTLDHVTVVGLGLLGARGFSPELPLKVEVRDSILRGPALLRWPQGGPELAKSIAWSGRHNHYAPTGPAWVLSGADGTEPLPGGPTDLDTWSKAIGAADADSRVGPLEFASGEPTDPGPHAPVSFTPAQDADKALGADPARVGPRAGDQAP